MNALLLSDLSYLEDVVVSTMHESFKSFNIGLVSDLLILIKNIHS
jgi:hypothetical protein